MTLDDLLSLGDEDFVLQAYRSLLGREADESGLASYLRQVRQGVDKSALLVALAKSSEGSKRGVQVEGLATLLERHDAPRPGRAQRALKRLIQPFRPEPLEPVLRQQRALENRLYRIEALLQQQAAVLQDMDSRLGRLAAAAPQSAAGSLPAATARAERLVPPAASRHYQRLAQTLARRHDPGR